MEDAVFETAVVGIESTDKHEPVTDWAAGQKYREPTMETTIRPATSRRRTPRSSPQIDANEVEERDRAEYIKKFHKTEGVQWEVAVQHDVNQGGVCEDAQAGECDDRAQKEVFEKNPQSHLPVQGDQVDEARPAIHCSVPKDQGGEEVQGNNEIRPQDDAWQEILSKMEEMPLDTTVTCSLPC